VRPAALALAVISLALPTAAGAAVKSGIDRDGGMRLTLDGRVLTAKILRQKVEEQLFGKRIDAICSPHSLPSPRGVLVRRRLWPRGASQLSFTFGRDISRRARWCLIEYHAGDIAFVSFVEREPVRFVGKGRGPSGSWWRLAGWRGLFAEPCALLRAERFSYRPCFPEFSERPITLGVRVYLPCAGDDIVFGVVSRRAANVRVVTEEGLTFEAKLYDPATESRVRGRYLVAALPEEIGAGTVQSFDAEGSFLAQRRFADPGPDTCE
jgi:hypothetical protein